MPVLQKDQSGFFVKYEHDLFSIYIYIWRRWFKYLNTSPSKTRSRVSYIVNIVSWRQSESRNHQAWCWPSFPRETPARRDGYFKISSPKICHVSCPWPHSLSGDYHITVLMKSKMVQVMGWCVRQRSITSTHVDPYTSHHMASQWVTAMHIHPYERQQRWISEFKCNID